MGLALAALAALALTGAGGESEFRPGQQVGRFTLDDARGFAEYPLYFAGDRIARYALVAVLHRSGTAEFVSFVYGDCVAADDTGCVPPIEIQVWPACRRSLALYGSSPAGPALERTTIRSAPAAVLDDGTRLELQTGRSTVVVFARSRVELGRIAGALRSVDSRAADGGRLPPPAAGALEGELDC